MDIGNTLEDYVKVSEQTRQLRYTSYARLCIYLDISQELPKAIELTHDDLDWIQPIDYEQIPFRCQRCHEHGHLFRDCPLTQKPSPSGSDACEADGFTKVENSRKSHKKQASKNKM